MRAAVPRHAATASRARRRITGSRNRTRTRLRAAAIVIGIALAIGAANLAYHVVRKPTELLGVMALTSPRTPLATWRTYGALFEESATGLISPPLLAALVQVESQGDPLARTSWRWRWSWNPVEWYAPASSAVGLLQITDATYQEARRYCIHDHHVARAGAWYDPHACWFNWLYSRPVASHSIEMTAARLHVIVTDTLADTGLHRATRAQKEELAAVAHLCGAARAVDFARRGFRAARGERCGNHEVRDYLARVGSLAREFARLRGAG